MLGSGGLQEALLGAACCGQSIKPGHSEVCGGFFLQRHVAGFIELEGKMSLVSFSPCPVRCNAKTAKERGAFYAPLTARESDIC